LQNDPQRMKKGDRKFLAQYSGLKMWSPYIREESCMNQDSEGANMEGHENPENGKLFCGALHAQLSYSSTTHS